MDINSQDSFQNSRYVGRLFKLIFTQITVTLIGLLLISGGEPQSQSYNDALNFFAGLVILLFCDMGLTVCRGSDIGKMPVNARIGCGFFPAVVLYVATTVWYCYGCKIYLTLGMPTFEKENISTNAAEINIEVFKAIH